MGRRSFAALIVPALVWVAAGAAAKTDIGDGPRARLVVLEGQTRAFVDGALSDRGVKDPPGSADLRAMTLERADAGGYVATLTFAAPTWTQISTYAGRRATHQVFVSLQPPTGARMRVHRDSSGVATLDRAEGDAFVHAGAAVARAAGPSVIFDIAPSVGMTADWEVQGHVLLRNAAGGGVHAHTAQVRAGSLSGEDGRVLRLPVAGTRLNGEGVPILWEPRVTMPAGSRPVTVRLARREGGLAVEVEMDAPPVPATLGGKTVTGQYVGLLLGDPAAGGYTILYDVVGKRVVGAAPDGTTGLLDPSLVTVTGKVLRFLVPEMRAVALAHVLDDAVPVGDLFLEDTDGEIDGHEVFQPTGGCNASSGTRPIVFEVVDGVVRIRHDDGDVATGPPSRVRSPIRDYRLRSVDGSRISGTLITKGCTHTLTLLLNRPVTVGTQPAGDASGAPTPTATGSTSAPPSASPVPPVGPATDIGVAGIVSTSDGGASIETPTVPAGTLLPPAPAGGFPLVPVGAGVLVITFVGGRFYLHRRGTAVLPVPADTPSVLDQIDEDPRRDCSALEDEVERRRGRVADARRRLERREREEDAADQPLEDLLRSAGEVGEFFDLKVRDAGTPEGAAFRGEVERLGEAGSRAASETSEAKYGLADAERKLKDAEDALRRCREGS